jgi:hypothetical protein
LLIQFNFVVEIVAFKLPSNSDLIAGNLGARIEDNKDLGLFCSEEELKLLLLRDNTSLDSTPAASKILLAFRVYAI